MQRTALCALKIGAFLKVGIGSIPVPIYRCAAADAQAVGRQPSDTKPGSYGRWRWYNISRRRNPAVIAWGELLPGGDLMYAIETLDIHGYQTAPVPNAFFRQQQGTDHLAIVFPGIGYTAQMPVLYYPTRLLLSRAADVLRVDYVYNRPEFQALSATEQDRWFQIDITAAYSAAKTQRHYTHVTLVGKSIGTLALGHLLATTPLPPIRCVWLTPLLRNDQLRRQMCQIKQPALLVIGTADPHYNATYLAEVEAATDGRSVIIEGADHSLEIDGKLVESIQAQARIIEALEQFIT